MLAILALCCLISMVLFRGLPDCSVPCPSLSSPSCLVPIFNTFFIDYLCCTPHHLSPFLGWTFHEEKTEVSASSSGPDMRQKLHASPPGTPVDWDNFRGELTVQISDLCTSVLTLLFSWWLPFYLMGIHIRKFSRYAQLRLLTAFLKSMMFSHGVPWGEAG